jgi:hypothetical protein
VIQRGLAFDIRMFLINWVLEMRFPFLLVFVCLCAVDLSSSSPIERQKRQSSAKAWINGREVDLSGGGTYKDKNGNFVAVSNNGNGISMVSSSGGNGGGCAIVVSYIELLMHFTFRAMSFTIVMEQLDQLLTATAK